MPTYVTPPLPTLPPVRAGGLVGLPRDGIIDVAEKLLREIDPKPEREGLAETPLRVAKAWRYWTRGYAMRPAEILKTFEDGAEGYDQMLVEGPVPIFSVCEHHLAPFFGHAWVGYLPDKRIVGLSKLVRLAECFAARLQVQERLTVQICDALMEHLEPRAAAVMVKCRHMCMESRGVQTPGVFTTTTAIRGEFQRDASAKNEFLTMCMMKDLAR